jgi:hypothetical protein
VLWGHSPRNRHASGTTWTRRELIALQAVHSLLVEQLARTTPLSVGVWAVLSAPDRDGFLAAIERYPELLTDKGEAGLRIVELFTVQLDVPRVTEWVKRTQAAVQAVREARA